MAYGESIGDGRLVVASSATAQRLSATHVTCRWVLISAETDNTGIVTVGGSTVVAADATRRGIPLAANATVPITCRDLYDVFVACKTDGDGVTFIYMGQSS